MTKAPLVLTQVSTTIGVPQSYYSKAWSEQWLAKNPDKTAADIPPLDDLNRDKLKRETEENIQKAVAGMLPPVTEGGDRYAQVTVYDFLDLTSPPLPTISLAQTAMFWLGNYWQSLALLGVALVGLGMAYSLSKAQPTGTDRDFAEGFGLDIIVEAANAAAQAAATASDVEDGESERQKRAFGTQSEDLKTELSSLINENPDAAANLLRSWIGQGT